MKDNSYLTRDKDILWLAGATLLILLLSILFLVPKIKEVFSLRQKTKIQELEMKKLAGKLADLQTLSEAELFDSANILLQALPPQKDFYQFLTILRKAFQDNQVKVESFSFSPGLIATKSGQKVNDLPSENQTENQMMINLSFSSDFVNFKNLVVSLEKALPLLKVDSLKLTSSVASGGASLQNISGSFVVKSYFKSLPKTLGSVDKPLAKISPQDQQLIEALKAYSLPYTVIPGGEGTVFVGRENPFSF